MNSEVNFQRIIALAKKDIKRIVREPSVLFMIILFPIVLMVAFAMAFGTVGGTQSVTYQIGIVNLNLEGNHQQWSNYFIGNLTNIKILKIQEYQNSETAQSDLMQGKIQAVLVIPENFGQSCSSYWAEANPSLWTNTTLQLYLDSGSMFATQAIPPIIQEALITTISGTQRIPLQIPINIASPSMVASNKFTTFDYMAPGIFTFALIFLIMTISQSFTAERQQGLLRRINITPITSKEIMTSQVLANMIIALIQAILLLAMSLIVGYRPVGNLASFALAFAILIIFSLCCVGFGLITAVVSKSPEVATGISFIFIIPLMFLGTFVTSGLSTIAQAAGKFVPSYYVTDALTSLFLRGAPITSPTILFDTLVVLLYSIIVLMLGIILFKKFGRRG
ncbi:MAG: ABC transporter permease [archaeon]|nr:ABC transporter permease [archaeon]